MAPALRASSTQKLTVEEWADLAGDVPGELVDGLLEEEEVTTYLHELIVACLIASLLPQLRRIGGLVFGSEAKVRVSRDRGRKPDISVYFPGSSLPSRRSRLATSPSLLIEVLSAAPGDVRRDRVTKRAEYASIGVPFYWVIDPDARTVEVFQLQAGDYVPLLTATSGVLALPGCEAVKLDLDDLWSGADDLPDDVPPSSRPRRKAAARRAPARRVARR